MLDLNNLVITTDSEIQRILTDLYGADKALKLWGYVKAQELGGNFNLPRTTDYRYRREITEAGIAPVMGSRQLPPLLIGQRESTVVQLLQMHRLLEVA